jgi:hypothetical protein
MTRPKQRAARVRRFFGLALLAAVLPLAGCERSQEGSVVLKMDPDAKTVGAAPQPKPGSPHRPVRRNAAQGKKVFVPG